MDKIRYGIVGFGVQGSKYAGIINNLKCVKETSVVTAICDIDEEKLKKAKKLYPGVKLFKDYNEMLDKKIIDVVLIETPHYFHPTIGIAALNKGLHILSDKPAGVYTKQVKELMAVAKQHPECQYGMMFNQRTNPLYIRAKELITSGKLGKLTRINWIITDWYRPDAYYAKGEWRGTWGQEGGGVMTNQSPHQLDLFTWFAGVPTEVTAITKTVGRNILVENDVTAMCKFANGATGVFVTSTHDAPGTNRLEITGTNGKIVIENDQITFSKCSVPEDEFNKKGIEGHPHYTTTTKKLKSFLPLFKKVPMQHERILENYSNVLLGREKALIASGYEGINGLTFSNAVYLSGWLNETVKIPFDEDLYFAELQKKVDEEKNK